MGRYGWDGVRVGLVKTLESLSSGGRFVEGDFWGFFQNARNQVLFAILASFDSE
jgi:hypothetical protein